MKKFLAALTVLTVMATPAFAQSFDPAAGTGNVRSFNDRPIALQNDNIAVRRGGLYDYVTVPQTRSASNQNDPAATGGGSVGYNEMLLIN
jgi:hypothetical protein